MVRAYAAMREKEALKSFTYEIRPLKPFEIVLDVLACGVCHSDVSLIDNEWGNSIYPLVPGHEIVGIVTQIGSQVDKDLLRKTVGIGWQHGSCQNCDTCKKGHSQVCPSKTLTCNGHFGGFGDKMIGDARFAYLIPEGLSLDIAAPLLCAGATVYSPLKKANLPKGAKVAILGVGGLGHLAIQFAKALGYHVHALSSSKDKKEEAFFFGADMFMTMDDLSNKERSFDFILSTYKLHETVDKILSLVAPFGTLCVVTRESIQLATSSLIGFERTLKGTTTTSQSMMQEMLLFAKKHNIAPKIEKMPFSKINEAIDIVRQGKARYRVVLMQER